MLLGMSGRRPPKSEHPESATATSLRAFILLGFAWLTQVGVSGRGARA